MGLFTWRPSSKATRSALRGRSLGQWYIAVLYYSVRFRGWRTCGPFTGSIIRRKPARSATRRLNMVPASSSVVRHSIVHESHPIGWFSDRLRVSRWVGMNSSITASVVGIDESFIGRIGAAGRLVSARSSRSIGRLAAGSLFVLLLLAIRACARTVTAEPGTAKRGLPGHLREEEHEATKERHIQYRSHDAPATARKEWRLTVWIIRAIAIT